MLRIFMMKRKEYLKEMKRSYDERNDLKDKSKVVLKKYLFDFLRAHHVLNISNLVTKICETHIFYYGFHTSSSGSVHPTSRQDVVDYLNNNGICNSAIQETTHSAEKYPWIIFTFCKAETI